jgi:two-component system phosphate regulon sensor histidine kinase PhoR
LVAAILMVSLPFYFQIKRVYEKTTRDRLHQTARLIEQLLSLENQEKTWWLLDRLAQEENLHLSFFGSNLTLIYDSFQRTRPHLFLGQNWEDAVELNLKEDQVEHFVKRLSVNHQLPFYYLSFKLPDKRIIRIGQDASAVGQQLWYYGVRLLGLSLLVAALAAYMSWSTGKRLTQPLEELEKKAHRFAQGDFQRTGEPFSISEFHALSQTMDHMAQQIEGQIILHQQQLHRHSAVLRSMAEGVLSVDMDMQIISVNPAFWQIFHIRESNQAVGKPLNLILRHQELLHHIKSVLLHGDLRHRELRVFFPAEHFLQVQISPLWDSLHRQIGAVVVCNDVTALRQLDEMRKEFVANVSHELKTPITAIKGFVETLLGGAIEDDLHRIKFLKIVQKHADRMNAIINDLLSLARLEHEKGGIESQTLQLQTVIMDALHAVELAAQEKHITVIRDIAPLPPLTGNASLLQQAFTNLLDNAIKYSPPHSEVQVQAFRRQNQILVKFIDQGEGVPEEHWSRLFERFYRIDKARSANTGGTGLGLSIVKHVIALHQGSVSLKSKKDKGSTFTVVLPCESPEHDTSNSF